MRRSPRLGARLAASIATGLAVLAAVASGPGGALAFPQQAGQPLSFEQVVGQPVGLPHLPPQGAWGEVINVTSRWIVIQNHSGQQYPVAVDDLGEFLIRWPMALDALTNQSVVEAVGQDIGNNTLQTDHIDVFEGNDRNLVSPTYNSVLPNNALVTTIDPGFNRYMSPWDYGGQNLLYGWAYPVNSGVLGIPSRLHVVGIAVNRTPLQVGLPGNNIATIGALGPDGFTITQVTRGNINQVRKGDYAFMMPQQIGQRGLILAQLVLYKKIPFRQFNPAVR